jgi:hypothetical protein
MKFLKFLGWSVIGLVLLSGLAYWLLPTIGSMLITQGLTNRGFTNVAVALDYPSSHALTIPSLTFSTPTESGSNSIIINNTEITYSLASLLKNVVETLTIEHIKIVWDSSLLEKPTDPSSSLPSPQTDSLFDFGSLGSGAMLPVLPFQHLRVKHVEISNPLAPPALQQISINASMDALQEGYEGTINIEGEGLLLNLLTFSLTHNGTVSFTGTHTNAPEDPVLDLKTSLERSGTAMKLQGTAVLKLHPFIHTLAALYPLPPEYQSVTGTFSGKWTGTIHEHPSQADSALGPIQGDFKLDAHMPTWPPFAHDIQLLTHGTFSVEGSAVTVALQPSSSGSVNLSLNSLSPPTLNPFISHKGIRSFVWKIQRQINVVIPIKPNLDAIQIPTGQILIAMRNSSEQLGILLSPRNLLWEPTSGLTGKGDVIITAHLKPASTPSLSLETLSLEASTSIEKSADQIVVTLNPSSFLHLSNMNKEAIHIPTLKGQFPKALSWTYHTEAQTWELQAAASALSLPSFSLQGKQWKLGPILTKDLMVTATPERWVINGETAVKQVRPPFNTIMIPASNWLARYSANTTSMTVQFNGQTLRHPLHIGGQGRHDFKTGDGSGTITLKPIRFAPQTLVLSQLIQPWPFPDMEVTHGTASASAEVTFGKATTDTDAPMKLKRLHGIVDFKEMGGFLTPTIMEGLTTRVEFLGEDETLHIPTTPVRIRSIQSPVGLTETSFLFSTGIFPQTSVPTLSITNMRTHLLGGKVSLSKAVIDPSTTTHEVTLQVRGLDLGEILRLEQQEAVKGTGTLDGTLPLFISGKEITVKQGSIQARPPGGTLQFEVSEETASSWAKSQPNLDLIVKSLQNYQYSKLEVDVDYEKNGILKLATKLEGKNPEFRKGVPIHFNLNIEENIPALMKSLSLLKDLENKIEIMMTGTGKASAKKKKEPSELP